MLSAPGPFADGASTPAYQRYRAETNRLLLFSEAVDVTLELPESEEGAGFGFSIATAQSKPGVHPPDRALFISSIKPGGAAQRSGQLQKHDRIVKVNDVDVTHGDQAAAVALIRTSGNRIVLTIAHRLKTKRRRESGAPTDVNTAASSNNNPSSNTKPTPLLTKALSGGGPVDVDDVMT